MSRPKLIDSDKKIKLSITISKDSNNILNELTNNKSKFIEELIKRIKYETYEQ